MSSNDNVSGLILTNKMMFSTFLIIEVLTKLDIKSAVTTHRAEVHSFVKNMFNSMQVNKTAR